jgi:hypothetical protein
MGRDDEKFIFLHVSARMPKVSASNASAVSGLNGHDYRRSLLAESRIAAPGDQ